MYCSVLYCAALHCAALYCTLLYCTVLYCTALHCTALYCIVLTVPYLTETDHHSFVGLNAMAMGGYRAKENHRAGSVKDRDDATTTATLPAPAPAPSGPMRSPGHAPVSVSGLSTADPRSFAYPRGNRASIEFAKAQEVEMLWLETVKVREFLFKRIQICMSI